MSKQLLMAAAAAAAAIALVVLFLVSCAIVDTGMRRLPSTLPLATKKRVCELLLRSLCLCVWCKTLEFERCNNKSQ
jgi:hypothetical protein